MEKLRHAHDKNKMKNSPKAQHERWVTENTVDDFTNGTEFKIVFHGESEKLPWKFFIEII